METLAQTILLKEYSKRIKAARGLVFVLAGICLLLTLFGLIVGLYAGFDLDSGPVIYGFGGYGLFYLIVGLVSLKRPLWCYAITAGLHAFVFIVIAATTHKSLYNDTYMATCITLVYLTIFLLIFLLTRGAISASKLKALQRDIDSETNN